MKSRPIEPDGRTYAFGPFRLCAVRQLLLCDGVPVRIGARAFDILVLLVRRAGELVSKEELTSFVWPHTFVHESNLKVNVAALRRAFAQAEPHISYIATIPGRGYRFVVPMEVEQAEALALSSSTRSPFRRKLPELPVVVGRDTEVAQLTGLLRHARCVTIVGPGGVGKTTAAIVVAHRAHGAYLDGACFVDLSTIGEPQICCRRDSGGYGRAPGRG